MKRMTLSIGRLVAMLTITTTVTAVASAQDVQFAGYADRLAAYESRVAALESRLQQAESVQPLGTVCCDGATVGCGEAESCCDLSSCCSNPCGFYFGYDNVIVQPFFENNIAYDVQFPHNLFPNFEKFVQFDWDTQYTPRIWLGYVNQCGVGFQVRYWEFDHATSRSITPGPTDVVEVEIETEDHILFLRPGTGETLVARHELDLDVYDFEATVQSNSQHGFVLYSAGLRYVEMDQRYSAVAAPGRLVARHSFEGAGPTASITGNRFIGIPGLSLVSTLRGAIVYGDNFSAVNDFTNGGANPRTMLVNSGSEAIGIGEIQAGLRWSRQVHNGSILSLHALFEGQYWAGLGRALGTVEGSHIGGGDVGFMGLAAGGSVLF